MPYVRRDGITNPEADGDRYDLGRYSETLSRVNTLALAWFYSGEEKYAAKATELLRVWFLDPATRMNPNMKNASALPGVYDGMPIGIIFSVALIKLVDYVRLLETSESWTSGDSSLLKKWFADYTGWLLESEFGKKEREALNNHGTWYSAQVAAFSMYSGNPERIVPAVEETKERIRRQVADDGSLPAELKRQRSLHYAIYGLQAFAYVARCAAFTGGPDLWHYKTADGRGLELAFGFLAPYLLQEKEWTWTNIEAGKPAAPAARQLMLWAAKAYDDPVLDRTARYLLQAVPEDSETRLTVRLPD